MREIHRQRDEEKGEEGREKVKIEDRFSKTLREKKRNEKGKEEKEKKEEKKIRN